MIQFINILQKEHTHLFQCMLGSKNLISNSKTERDKERQTDTEKCVNKKTRQNKEADAIWLVVHYSCYTQAHPLNTPLPPASLSAGHQQYFNVILSWGKQKVEYVTLGLDWIANDIPSNRKSCVQSLFMTWSVEFTKGKHSAKPDQKGAGDGIRIEYYKQKPNGDRLWPSIAVSTQCNLY